MNGREISNGFLASLRLLKSIEQMECGIESDMSLQDCDAVYKWLNDTFMGTVVLDDEMSNNLGRRLDAIKKRYEEGEG